MTTFEQDTAYHLTDAEAAVLAEAREILKRVSSEAIRCNTQTSGIVHAKAESAEQLITQFAITLKVWARNSAAERVYDS